MSDEQRSKGRRTIEVGPTGKIVAANLARLRKSRGLTTRQLSGALERAGRPIPASGITRMEKAERVVTVDDLVALAVVLNVSPVTLLLPSNVRGGKGQKGEPLDAVTEVTGAGMVDPRSAWDWAWCNEPLTYPEGSSEEEAQRHVMQFLLDSRPVGMLTAEGDDRLLGAAFGVPRGRGPHGSRMD